MCWEINRFTISHVNDIVNFLLAYGCLFSSKLGLLFAKYTTTLHLIPEYRKPCYENEQRSATVRGPQGVNSQQAVFKQHIFSGHVLSSVKRCNPVSMLLIA